MSFRCNGLGFASEHPPEQSPLIVRSPVTYRFHPIYEIRDQPSREIGDMPLSIGGDRIAPTAGDPHGAATASSR